MMARAMNANLRVCLLLLLLLAIIVMTILGFKLIYYAHPDIRFCYMDHEGPASQLLKTAEYQNRLIRVQRLDDVLLADYKPTLGRSIFFHETGCHLQKYSGDEYISTPLVFQHVIPTNIVHLTPRQACAIESAALHNPNFDIFTLFASPAFLDNTTSNALLEAVLSYPNVYLRNLNLWTYAAGTPIYDWFKDDKLFKSNYVVEHMSDFLRYLTLWRWGGIYLDTDIIVLRSMEDIPPNYTGAESDTHLAAGVMNFAHKELGHQIAELCLLDLQHNFSGEIWGNNGPGVITRVMQKVCQTNNIGLMLDKKRCMGFKVFDRDAFYAIPWIEWYHFFEEQYYESTMERIKKSYVAHVWNKHSKQKRYKVSSKAAYGKLAKEHCPRVYASVDFF